MSDYRKRIEAAIARLGLHQGVGITQCNVDHKPHCPMSRRDNPATRGGPCTCEPTITFIDAHGRQIREPARH